MANDVAVLVATANDSKGPFRFFDQGKVVSCRPRHNYNGGRFENEGSAPIGRCEPITYGCCGSVANRIARAVKPGGGKFESEQSNVIG